MSSCASRWVVLLVGVFTATAVAAELVVKESQAAPIVPPLKDVPPAVSQRQSAQAPILRCWQNGRLVIERDHVTLAEPPPGAYVLRKNDRKGAPIYVFDLQNGLCIVSNESVAVEPSR
jgi:hypothetical protein